MTVMHLAKFLRNKMDVPSKYKVSLCPGSARRPAGSEGLVPFWPSRIACPAANPLRSGAGVIPYGGTSTVNVLQLLEEILGLALGEALGG